MPVTYYKCNICHTQHPTVEEALKCETILYDFDPQEYKIGDRLYFTHHDGCFMMDKSGEVLRQFVETGARAHRIAYVVELEPRASDEEIESYGNNVGNYNPYVHGSVGIVRFCRDSELQNGTMPGYYCLCDDSGYNPSILMDLPKELPEIRT